MFTLPSQLKRRLHSPFERQRARLTDKVKRQRGKVVRNRRFLRARVQARRVERRLMANPVVALSYRTIKEMSADDATHMAAGLAYYAVLSLFPLSVGLISLLGLLLEPEALQSDIFQFLEDYLPVSEELLAANIEAAGHIHGFLGVISFFGLFWSASLMFGAITRSVNRAWDIHQDRPFYIDKVRNIGMALSVAPLFLLSVSTTAALQMLEGAEFPGVGELAVLEDTIIGTLSRVLPFLFSLTIFLLIYKFTPNTRTQWRYIWPGAVLAAVLFEVSKSIFVFYVDNFANYEEVYGSLASVIVLLAWTYFSGLILITGAEFTSEYERMRYGVERGQVIPKHGGRESRSAEQEGQ
jgi:membrane protein